MKIDKKSFSRKHSALIGIFSITLAAFFGFNAVFSELRLSIGVQAVTAAFGALFIILSTKYLMEQESESKLVSEKRRAIFDDRLKEYKKSAAIMADVLKDHKVSLAELTDLQQQHVQLVLLGSREAIESSREFVEKCQELIKEKISDEGMSDFDGSVAADLGPDQERELWAINLKYLAAARIGLELPEDDFQREAEQKAFGGIISKDIEIQEQVQTATARVPLTGGLDQWKKERDLDPKLGAKLDELIEIIMGSSPDLGVKYTKTQISFQNMKHKNNQNIFYIGGISRKKGIINCSTYQGDNERSSEEMAEKLSSFEPELTSRTQNNRTTYGVKLKFQASQINDEYLKPLTAAIPELVEELS